MPRTILDRLVRGITAAVLATACISCGPSPLTATRIEASIETTFANLVELQASRMKLAPLPAPDFAVTAICRKPTGTDESGSGDWVCTLVWQGPNRETLRDNYDLLVNTDGCYTATIEGDTLGGPVLKAPDGAAVKNLLYAFEGCFEVS
jgi:hypothetical protein